MTENKTARSTIAYLIVRDQAHENAYAKALESLGVDWGRTLPIPKTNAERFPEVKKLLDLGLQSKQYSFSLDDLSEGSPMTIAAERMEEFSPGLDTDLLALLQATAEMELAEVQLSYGPVAPAG